MMEEWDEKAPCPHCGGKVKSWYVFDDYGPSGGTYCENEGSMQCSLTLAWQTFTKERKKR